MLHLLLIQTLLTNPMEQDPLQSYKWKNRVLLVFAKDEKLAAEQLDLLWVDLGGIADRDLVIIRVTAEEATVLYGKEATRLGNSLNTKYNSSDEPFRVLLIGKDGGIKLDEDEKISATFLYQLIDSMPMRQQEMRNKKGDQRK